MDFADNEFDLVYLRKQIAAQFSIEEMNTLCFDLHILDEDVGGNTLEGKSRELVKYCYRRGITAQLLQMCRDLRPKSTWTNTSTISEVSEKVGEGSENGLIDFYALIKGFNRNRNQPFSDKRTFDGDDIAFAMRELAPFLFEKVNALAWLQSPNPGKRLAAMKYIEWLQDTEYLELLLDRLESEKPFLQLHCLLAISSLIDQLTSKQRIILRNKLTAYNPNGDPYNNHWKKIILDQSL